MVQRFLFGAGLMLVIFPSWGQVMEDFNRLEGVELDASVPLSLGNEKNIVIMGSPLEKIDRMPIVEPSPNFQSNMTIATLSPNFKSNMPIYNDQPLREGQLPFRDFNPTKDYGESRFGPLMPKMGPSKGTDENSEEL